MPFLPSKGFFPGSLASGLLLALGLAIGCTPSPGGGGGPMANPTPGPTTAPTPRATSNPTATPTPSSSPSVSQTSVSFSTQVAPLLSARCAECHRGAGLGGVSLFDSSGNARYDNIRTRLSSIIEQVASGNMPRTGPRLTQAEVGLLQTWSANGAPNN